MIIKNETKVKESSKIMFALNIKHFVVLKFLTCAFSINYKQIIHIYRINWKERRKDRLLEVTAFVYTLSHINLLETKRKIEGGNWKRIDRIWWLGRYLSRTGFKGCIKMYNIFRFID